MKNRTWRSLTQVKKYIELHKLEKVKSFNGWELVTDKNIYGLCDGQLICRAKK